MSLFTPEFGLVFWMLVVFLILFGILAKYAWPAIVRMMDERADFIDKGVEYTREAKRDREKAQEEAKALLAEAHRQQLEVLQQTERLKREMIADARKAAENEAKQSAPTRRLLWRPSSLKRTTPSWPAVPRASARSAPSPPPQPFRTPTTTGTGTSAPPCPWRGPPTAKRRNKPKKVRRSGVFARAVDFFAAL